MSMKITANSLVSQVFEFLDTLTILATYHHTTDPVYNPLTETFIRNDISTFSNIKAIPVALSDEEQVSDVGEAADSKLFIEKKNLGSIIPKLDDYISVPYGTLEIKRIKKEPTESIFIFYVRGK